MRHKASSFIPSLSEGMVSAAISTLFGSNEYETSSANISNIACYIEDLGIVKTEVTLSIKSSTTNNIHKLKSELTDTKEYSEYIVSNNEYTTNDSTN